LPAIGLEEIEMRLHRRRAVSGRTLIQEEQRILDVERIGVEDIVEDVVGVLELGGKLVAEVFADFEAAAANAGADGGEDFLGL